MLETYKQSIANQLEAALCMLDLCVERCPDAMWNGRVGNLAFCQVAFHTLFFTDFYLGGPDEESFRSQPFHVANRHIFRDYEELEDRVQVLLYDKPGIKAYCGHCRIKASQVIAAETEDSLRSPVWIRSQGVFARGVVCGQYSPHSASRGPIESAVAA